MPVIGFSAVTQNKPKFAKYHVVIMKRGVNWSIFQAPVETLQ